ncbi:hypothetical protein [Flavobacterium selenitireducens]|uniref:hypothetical protein n=1 Tax=Flavobacterium selenitireducens TaxID=2722704 RepID=UPI00168AFAE0|nr:hypothetical protein [Flavobacterium selenitireducens]MBD3581960.1 hypothetical protein [Flavobacterium selenitireducens]
MKKTILLIICIFALLSCGDDDKAPVVSEVRLENQTYALDQAHYDSFESAYVYFEITNSQSLHMVRLVFKQIDAMPNGTYTLLSPDDPDYDPALHFAGGAVYPALDKAPIPFVSGTVRFSRSGSRHTIVFDIETTQGSLEGTYAGPIVP